MKKWMITLDDGEHWHAVTVKGKTAPVKTGPRAIRLGRSSVTFEFADVAAIAECKPGSLRKNDPEAAAAERQKIIRSVVQMMAANAPYTRIVDNEAEHGKGESC